MKRGFFFRSKRGIAIPVLVLLALIATLWAVIAPLWLSVGRSNPISGVTNSLLTNTPFKIEAGQYFVTKMKKDASGDELKLLQTKGDQVATTLTVLLNAPQFKSNVDGITNQVYDYYILGSEKAKSISVKPLATLAINALVSVDPQFKKLQKEIDKIKPIDLKPKTNGPDLKQIHSLLNFGFILISFLLLILIFIYAIFARKRTGFLRTIGIYFIYIGLLDIAIHTVGIAISNHQIKTMTDDLARTAVPIVITRLASPLMTIGISLLILGIIGFGLSFRNESTEPQ